MTIQNDSVDINFYKESPYTITLDWKSGTVWISDHINKNKFVLTEKDSQNIARNFELYKNFKD